MDRRDGKTLMPQDLTPRIYEGSSIIENLVLASSNLLRSHLGLKDRELVPGPIPRFVTRINPSLDNYFADLLLRSCYVPVDYMPAYEEHVIRGSQDELPSVLNPRLVGSVLIGIGYRNHGNPDFKRVYDEHDKDGQRWVPSASQVVFEEHLKAAVDRTTVRAMMETVLDEVNDIDSQGESGGDHLSKVVKNLNMARFRQPGFVAEPLEPQWKRAILGAVLSATCVTAPVLQRASHVGGGELVEEAVQENLLAIADLRKEWDAYIQKSDKMRSEGYLDDIGQGAKEYVRKRILDEKIPTIGDHLSYFTLRRAALVLKRVWHEKVVSFVLSFLFEAQLQAQQSFEEMSRKKVPVRTLPRSFEFYYYEKEPRDMAPQRALTARLNKEKKRGVVVLHDPIRQITSVFRNNYIPYDVWKRFLSLLVEKEGTSVWYIPTEDGKYGQWALNGTESFRDVPMTALTAEDFFQLFSQAVQGK